MKKMIWKPAAVCALSLAVLTGCGAPAANSTLSTSQYATVAKVAGTVLLSVNPEIEVEYDGRGLVLEIEGLNDDGKSVVGGYTGYEGRPCREVVNELVEEIYEDGYFEESVAGRSKNIVIKLEEGSTYPNDDFLEDVAQGVRDVVRRIGMDSKPMTVEEQDLDDKGYIGLDKAKELVLGQLGLSEADFTDKEYELDDGVYELEFTSEGAEYEFEVNAVNGKVLEADYDHNDDWHDDDDNNDDLNDDDDNNDDLNDDDNNNDDLNDDDDNNDDLNDDDNNDDDLNDDDNNNDDLNDDDDNNDDLNDDDDNNDDLNDDDNDDDLNDDDDNDDGLNDDDDDNDDLDDDAND